MEAVDAARHEQVLEKLNSGDQFSQDDLRLRHTTEALVYAFLATCDNSLRLCNLLFDGVQKRLLYTKINEKTMSLNRWRTLWRPPRRIPAHKAPP